MFVLIIDDHPMFREGLKAVLSALDPTARTMAVATVAEALASADPTDAPDLVLLDMALPGTCRLEALQVMRGAFADAPIVVVSGDEDPVLIHEAIESGAAGYIPKTTDPSLALQALRLVLANGTYMPRSAITAHAASAIEPSSMPHFSDRQLAVLKALLQGKANKVIARELDIAEGTVKAHLWAVYQALGVTTRTQAMYRAHELDLFEVVCR
jgi:DNA-binding NarL/FixJ family response regulator